MRESAFAACRQRLGQLPAPCWASRQVALERLQRKGRWPPSTPIQNRLHWVLDVVFRGALMRRGGEHGPKNMATGRHLAMNFIRAAPGTDSFMDNLADSLEAKRKAAARGQHRLRDLITGLSNDTGRFNGVQAAAPGAAGQA